jgi:arylsulfatase A-like enzyme
MFYDGKDPYDPENRSLEEWWEDPLGGLAKDTWLRHPEGLITDIDYVAALYDQEIRYLDDAVTDILSVVDELGLTENTLVVFLADHGTSLTKHGIFFEHHGLYDDTIHVPLILRWPGRLQPGSRFDQMLHMSDVGPTILEAADLPIPEETDGTSAWPLLSGQASEGGHDRIVSAECTWQAKWSLRTDRYKLIVSRDGGLHGGPRLELYDLERDPSEEHNLAEEKAATAREMEDELEGWIAKRLEELGKDEDPLVEQGISLKHLTA